MIQMNLDKLMRMISDQFLLCWSHRIYKNETNQINRPNNVRTIEAWLCVCVCKCVFLNIFVDKLEQWAIDYNSPAATTTKNTTRKKSFD